MKKIAVIFGLAALLSGCGGVGSVSWFNNTPLEQQVAHFQSVCQAYGFEVGSQAMAQCVAEERRATQLRNLLETQSTLYQMDEMMREQLLRSRCLRNQVICD